MIFKNKIDVTTFIPLCSYIPGRDLFLTVATPCLSPVRQIHNSVATQNLGRTLVVTNFLWRHKKCVATKNSLRSHVINSKLCLDSISMSRPRRFSGIDNNCCMPHFPATLILLLLTQKFHSIHSMHTCKNM